MVDLLYTVQIDWNNNDDWTDTGEDVTARVLGLSWSRGKDRPHYLAGKVMPGKAKITLNNVSGDYSPSNSGSPLAGNLLPGRPVRIRSTGSGAIGTRWQGFIQSIDPRPRVSLPNTATINCIGPLGYIANRSVEVAMETSITTGAAIGKILDAAGWPAGARDIDTGLTTMTRWWVDRKGVIPALRVIEETEFGLLYETKDGKIAFRDRGKRFASRTSAATFSDATAAALSYSAIKQRNPDRGIFNSMETEVQIFTVGGSTTLWAYAESGVPYMAPGESLTFWGRYPVQDTNLENVGVDAWATPDEPTPDYQANSQESGGGTDISTSLGVVSTKFGESMRMVFTNNHATLPAFMVDTGGLIVLQARGTPVIASDPTLIREEDATSQTTYGQRTFQGRDTFIPTTLDAISWGQINLDLYKDPSPQIAITVNGNRSIATLDEMEDRDLTDRVTVKADGDAGLGFDQDWYIESEQMTVDANLFQKGTWTLSSSTGFDLYWLIDTSLLGTNTKPGF